MPTPVGRVLKFVPKPGGVFRGWCAGRPRSIRPLPSSPLRRCLRSPPLWARSLSFLTTRRLPPLVPLALFVGPPPLIAEPVGLPVRAIRLRYLARARAGRAVADPCMWPLCGRIPLRALISPRAHFAEAVRKWALSSLPTLTVLTVELAHDQLMIRRPLVPVYIILTKILCVMCERTIVCSLASILREK